MMQDFQDTERDIFKRLRNEDQSIALFDMLRVMRGDIAGVKRAILNMQDDITQYRKFREAKENPQNTEDKIEAVLSKRFNGWEYLRDKVIPGIVQLIIIALLYQVFAK